jgi:hypothetical protein
VENIGKIITFKVENREFKLDLVEKRQKKAWKWAKMPIFCCF